MRNELDALDSKIIDFPSFHMLLSLINSNFCLRFGMSSKCGCASSLSNDKCNKRVVD